MASVIEDHPQVDQINRAILNKQSLDKMVQWISPPVSRAAIQRYRTRVLSVAVKRQTQVVAKQVLEQVQQVAPNTSSEVIRSEMDRRTVAQPFIRALERKHERYERWMAGAEEQGDWKALAAIDRAETGAIQLQAQLADAFPRQDAASATQVNIAICLPEPTRQADGPVIDIDPL